MEKTLNHEEMDKLLAAAVGRKKQPTGEQSRNHAAVACNFRQRGYTRAGTRASDPFLA